ncbi:relaxase, partial [Streptococcus pluranimalium]
AKIDKDGDKKSLGKEIKELKIELKTLHKVRDQIDKNYDFTIEMTKSKDERKQETKRRSM